MKIHSRVTRLAVASALVVGLVGGIALPAANAATCAAFPECAQTTDFPLVVGMAHYWRFNGAGCGVGCSVQVNNADGCNPAGSWLIAVFNSTTNNATHSCVFNCGTRGTCTARGGDGLPVELLHFGVE